MLVLLSPSKTQDFQSPIAKHQHSMPHFLQESEELLKEMKKLSPAQIGDLMKISDNLAAKTYESFQKYQKEFSAKNSRQAIFAYQGDVYRDIDSTNYSKEDLEFAQKTLRIITGLYGFLRPLDLMQPYRLEMKYQTKFWQEKLTEYFSNYLKKHPQPVINLASKEYSSSIKLNKLPTEVYDIVFKEGPKYRIVAIYAKIARGTMANWIVKNQIEKAEDLKKFKEDGYKFDAKLSTEKQFTFTRK